MELRHLRYFLAAAREGNMTRAAAACHVSQPALSRQLADLERELGCELFLRESRGVSLTDAGMLLRKRAEEIVALADRAELELRTDLAEVEGDVWVGAGESRSMELVARAAASMAQAHPHVRVRLYSGNCDDVHERVDKGLLDFGVVMGHRIGQNFDSLKLPWEDRWGVLLWESHPLAQRSSLTLDDLRGERLIVSTQRHQAGNDEKAEESLSVQFCEENGLEVVATYTLLFNASLLVEQHVGIALCFGNIVSTGPSRPLAFVPLEGVASVESWLIWKRFQPQSQASKALLREIRALCTTDWPKGDT